MSSAQRLLFVAVATFCLFQAADAAAPPADPKMTWEAYVTLFTCIAVLLGLSTNVVGCAPAMVVSAVFLYLCGIVTFADVLSGMSNSSVATIALLFVVVDPIADLPKVRSAVGRVLGDLSSRTGTRWATFKIVALCLATSSFLNNAPQVAVLTNIIKLYCRDCGASPSQILLPMNFATLCGNYALIGTSTNLIVDGLMQKYGLGKMPFFELLKITGPFTVIMVLYLVFTPAYLLPIKAGGMFRAIKEKGAEYFSRLRVKEGSPVASQKIASLLSTYHESALAGVDVLQLERDDVTIFPVTGDEVLAVGDIVMVRGDVVKVREASTLLGLEWLPMSVRLDQRSAAIGTSEPLAENAIPRIVAEAPEEELSHNQIVAPQPPSLLNVTPPPTPAADTPLATRDRRRSLHSSFAALPSNADLSILDQQTIATSFAFGAQGAFTTTHLLSTESHTNLFEVVLGPRNVALGATVASGHFQRHYGSTVLAVRAISGLDSADLYNVDLAEHMFGVGDTALILSRSNFRDQWHVCPDFVAINEVDAHPEDSIEAHFVRIPTWVPCLGHTVTLSTGTVKVIHVPGWYPYISVLIFAIMLGFAIAEYDIAVLALLATIASITLGLTTTSKAIQAVEWEVIIMVAFSFALASAMTNSGFANVLGKALKDADVNGIRLLYLISGLATMMTNVITNKACVQVLIPIVVASYRDAGQDPTPAVIMTCALASMALSTPYGFATNLMVMGPGGYKPIDFIRFGLPLNLLAAACLPIITALVYGMPW